MDCSQCCVDKISNCHLGGGVNRSGCIGESRAMVLKARCSLTGHNWHVELKVDYKSLCLL